MKRTARRADGVEAAGAARGDRVEAEPGGGVRLEAGKYIFNINVLVFLLHFLLSNTYKLDRTGCRPAYKETSNMHVDILTASCPIHNLDRTLSPCNKSLYLFVKLKQNVVFTSPVKASVSEEDDKDSDQMNFTYCDNTSH